MRSAFRDDIFADGLLLATAIMWGTNILVFRHTVVAIDPLVFNFLRLVPATTTLGMLWCIDATKRGDVSPTIVTNAADRSPESIRSQAFDPDERVVSLCGSRTADGDWCESGPDSN